MRSLFPTHFKYEQLIIRLFRPNVELDTYSRHCLYFMIYHIVELTVVYFSGWCEAVHKAFQNDHTNGKFTDE